MALMAALSSLGRSQGAGDPNRTKEVTGYLGWIFFLLMLLTSDAGRQALNSNYEQVMVFLFSELQALGSRRAHCREGQAAHSQGTGPSNFKVYRIS